MKHNQTASANAVAVTIAFIYIVCALTVVVAPEFSMAVAQSWFHGIDIATIRAYNISAGSFVLGIVTATAGGWIVGYVFASLYNTFLKK